MRNVKTINIFRKVPSIISPGFLLMPRPRDNWFKLVRVGSNWCELVQTGVSQWEPCALESESVEEIIVQKDSLSDV